MLLSPLLIKATASLRKIKGTPFLESPLVRHISFTFLFMPPRAQPGRGGSPRGGRGRPQGAPSQRGGAGRGRGRGGFAEQGNLQTGLPASESSSVFSLVVAITMFAIRPL